jgi:ribosomal protein S27AE
VATDRQRQSMSDNDPSNAHEFADKFVRASDEEKRAMINEHHDLEGSARKAHTELDELDQYDWEVSDERIIERMRNAKELIERALKNERMLTEYADDDDDDERWSCPTCGGDSITHEDIGHGQNRFYCTDCDETLQVG